MALGGAAALGSLPLILAALVALAAAHWAVLRHVTRLEEEADAMAAALMGSVIPGLPTADPPKSWRGWLWSFWACYPTRRPWLHQWATAELVGLYERGVRRG